MQNADDVGKSLPSVCCHEDAESIQKQISVHEEIESQSFGELSKTFSTELFKKLMENAQRNCSIMPQGRRHSEIMKKFSLSLLLMIGPSAYKLMHINMPEAFPLLSTVVREANKHYQPLKEGEFCLTSY